MLAGLHDQLTLVGPKTEPVGARVILEGARGRSVRGVVSIALVCLAANVALSQTSLSFEVASVRLNSEFPPLSTGVQIRAEQFDATNYPLPALISMAHGISRIEGASDWMSRERYDIRAKAPGPSSRQEMLQMLQTLLTERFRLKAHRETRTMDIYGLVVARPDSLGRGLHPVKVDCETNEIAEGPDPKIFPGARPRCGNALVSTTLVSGPVLTTSRYAAITLEKLAGTFSGVGRPVFDRTGLTGTFDVELAYVREMPPGPFLSAPSREPPQGPSLRDAIKEQLGLDFRSERGPVEFFVIDSIERPQPN